MGRVLKLGGAVLLAGGLLYLLAGRPGGLPPMGALLDPAGGLYRTARSTGYPARARIALPALDAPVTIVRGRRGVPHIFAHSGRDAVVALGYVTAQDRLFQLDFLPRVAAGRLAEAFGPPAIPTDRFLRQTGMLWGARKNLRRIREEKGIEWKLLNWYAAGVNAWIEGLSDEELPLGFRLLGYRPDRYAPLDGLLLLQYMTLDLTWGSDDPRFAILRRRLGPVAYGTLFPRRPYLYVPIIPPAARRERAGRETGRAPFPSSQSPLPYTAAWGEVEAFRETLRGTLAEGFIPGKGSNNWAVTGERSATGGSLLAGDMHLSLTLPSIWYEVHLVTPEMDLYGVTIPGSPVLIEGFNDEVAWTFTNTGADQIDHYALTLDATGTRYRYEGEWRPLRAELDTIYVNGAEPVLDTLYFSHWGPVFRGEWPELGAVAIQWVAHHSSSTMQALWQMGRARSAAGFREALRYWDSPMQNVLYATQDTIAIRSTGYLPIRKGRTGAGLLDGSTAAGAWVGRVPFADLPHATNPPRGYLTSTNQPPVDTSYAYYLGYDWSTGWRSLRIDSLLSAQPQHGVEDLMRYQRDVRAMQHAFFAPLLDTLSIPADQERADRLRDLFVAWDGETTTGSPEALILAEFMDIIEGMAWDEPVFLLREEPFRPNPGVLVKLLKERPRSRWLDIEATPAGEDAAALLRAALSATADTLARAYGWGAENWRWGAHHHVIFRHITTAEPLRALWRGPFPFPGFVATLSPGRGRPTTHSASWRMVVDLSREEPRGWGVYPGGQSGNPFSPLYDLQIPTYLAFDYYELRRPEAPEEVKGARSRMVLVPGEQ